MTKEEIMLLEEASELNSRRNRFLYDGGSDPLIEMTVSEWWCSIPERNEPSPIAGEIEVGPNPPRRKTFMGTHDIPRVGTLTETLYCRKCGALFDNEDPCPGRPLTPEEHDDELAKILAEVDS